MRHHNRPWKGRACKASAREDFERALWGEEASDRKPFDPRSDRKTLQLCRQVQQALMLALSGDCGDDLLREIYVAAVEPMGSASQLVVRVAIPAALKATALQVLERLHQHGPRLRALVARSICRKRVPMLTYIIAPFADGGDHANF